MIKFYIEAYVADGILCISKYLVDFFKQKGIPESKLFLVPSTVDASRFKQIGTNPIPEPYIGYFGSLSFERDNIDLLINAFARVSNDHPNVRLILGGYCAEADKRKIQQLIKILNISDKVQLLGFLSRQEITRYITHASLLVMVRSKDMQSDASYPSKLSEFLATSKPVISVKVGDVPAYLTDNVNAFLVEPGDINGLARKLDFVLNNYQQAQKVGQRGYELSTTTFSYNYQVKRLMTFIEVLDN